MLKNRYSIYYDHIQYTLIEWELPADIEVYPENGLENYDAIRWGIEHGIFDLIPIASYGSDGMPLDADGEEFDERCIEADVWHDSFSGYMIPFYEFRIAEAGHSPYCHSLEELSKGKPAIRK